MLGICGSSIIDIRILLVIAVDDKTPYPKHFICMNFQRLLLPRVALTPRSFPHFLPTHPNWQVSCAGSVHVVEKLQTSICKKLFLSRSCYEVISVNRNVAFNILRSCHRKKVNHVGRKQITPQKTRYLPQHPAVKSPPLPPHLAVLDWTLQYKDIDLKKKNHSKVNWPISSATTLLIR